VVNPVTLPASWAKQPDPSSSFIVAMRIIMGSDYYGPIRRAFTEQWNTVVKEMIAHKSDQLLSAHVAASLQALSLHARFISVPGAASSKHTDSFVNFILYFAANYQTD
jgi:hypothetical protein